MKRRLFFLALLLLCGVVGVSAQSERSRRVVSIDSRNYYLHTVCEGQSVGDIAALYSLSTGEVVEENDLDPVAPAIAAGDILRVPCYERVSKLQPKRGDDRYGRYRPEGGESLFKVAVDYAISIDTLVEDNPGVDPANIRNRTNISIRRSASGITQLDEIERQSRVLAAVLNALSRRNDYVAVEEGQTLYSIAVERGVDVADLHDENGRPSHLYKGMILKIPREESLVDDRVTLVTSEIGEWLDSLAQPARDNVGPWTLYNEDEQIRVAVMLPLSDAQGRVRGIFVEFWQGAQMAARELNDEFAGGEVERTVQLQLFDTKNSVEQVEAIMNSEEMAAWHPSLFVGPIYERNQEPVLEYVAEMGGTIPVVSPLATTTNGEYGRHYYRLSPTSRSRENKLAGMVGPTTNVIMVYTASNDEKMESEVLSLLGDHPYGKVVYDENFVVDSLVSRPIEELMAEEDNLFVVLSDNELDTDRSLAIISSMMNSRQPKYGMRRVPIRVLGNADWAKYKNMDKNLLFKLDVSYLASYHADRGDRQVRAFDRKFMKEYGRTPSMFAYRAYDAVKLFVAAMFGYGDLTAELNGSVTPLLQTRYSFSEEGGNMVNDCWMLVNYRPNYTIEVK